MNNLVKKSFVKKAIVFISIALLLACNKPAAKEVNQYIVVCGFSGQDRFEKDINKKLSEGWHLQGGISTNGLTFLQAMVK